MQPESSEYRVSVFHWILYVKKVKSKDNALQEIVTEWLWVNVSIPKYIAEPENPRKDFLGLGTLYTHLIFELLNYDAENKEVRSYHFHDFLTSLQISSIQFSRESCRRQLSGRLLKIMQTSDSSKFRLSNFGTNQGINIYSRKSKGLNMKSELREPTRSQGVFCIVFEYNGWQLETWKKQLFVGNST